MPAVPKRVIGALVQVERARAATAGHSTRVSSTVTDLMADQIDHQRTVAVHRTRGEVTPGRDVVVFGAPPMDPVWHTPPGIALLGPRHFGFDFDHVPLELTERRP
jgi:DUF917 family protein